nr:acyl-CoA thioesterase/BAAT N-terminal domain-containing protein [Stenotrophomonas acidaminiphila]
MINALLLAAGLAASAPALEPPPPVVAGFPPQVRVVGLEPGDQVRLRTVRRFARWEQIKGRWTQVPVVLHAWADFRASGPMLDTKTAAPIAGTYQDPDPYGLLWSGRVATDPLVSRGGPVPEGAGLKEGDSELIAIVDGEEVGRAWLSFTRPPGIRVATMREPGVVGVYAAPEGKRSLPTVLLLHGSEGGKLDDAQALAERFAGQGFAALSVIYFAYDLAGVEGVSNTHLNTPVELLDIARNLCVV